MSTLADDIRLRMMDILKNEENKTDLKNLAVLSRVGLKICSSVSAEIDADAISAQSTALIDLGLRLSEATNHGSLMEIMLHNDSGYCILLAINDDYIIFGGLKAIYRIGYYRGYMRELARKLNRIISGDIETEMALSLEESELQKLRQKKIEKEPIAFQIKPSVEKDKAALNELLGFLDEWEKEGVEIEDLEAGNANNIVSIPKSMSIGLHNTTQTLESAGEKLPQETESSIAKILKGFKVYNDEIPPVPLEDYIPMEIEEEFTVPEELEVVEEPSSGENLPSFDELKPPDFEAEYSASEYDTEFILDEESEALDAILKDLGYDKEKGK